MFQTIRIEFNGFHSHRFALLRGSDHSGVSGHVPQNPAHRHHRPRNHRRPCGKMQPCAATIADVELPAEIRLDETCAFTLGRGQTCVLHESDETLLPESMLANLPG